MSPRTRRALSRSLLVLAAGAGLVGVLTLPPWKIEFGSWGQVSGNAGQIRVEPGGHVPDPFQFRAHPTSLQYFKRPPPLGPVLEIGAVPIGAAAGVLLIAGVIVRRPPRPPPRGVCPACRYSLSGLPPGTGACPECGAPLHAAPA